MMFTFTDAYNKQLMRGDVFRLIGRTTEFVVTQLYMAAGDIPAVVGWSVDGKYTTTARTADVILLREC